MSLNQQQFTNLHGQYQERLLNSVTSMTRSRQEAEDITATAFASAYKNRDSFRGEASPQTWVYAIAANEVKSRRRGGVVKLESIDGLDAKELTVPDVLDETLERAECRARVRAALRRVPALYRRVLVDHFMRGHSVGRIARQYRVPLGTVLSRIFKAKRLLRAAWEA